MHADADDKPTNSSWLVGAHKRGVPLGRATLGSVRERMKADRMRELSDPPTAAASAIVVEVHTASPSVIDAAGALDLWFLFCAVGGRAAILRPWSYCDEQHFGRHIDSGPRGARHRALCGADKCVRRRRVGASRKRRHSFARLAGGWSEG
jgi:hypothetical protein